MINKKHAYLLVALNILCLQQVTPMQPQLQETASMQEEPLVQNTILIKTDDFAPYGGKYKFIKLYQMCAFLKYAFFIIKENPKRLKDLAFFVSAQARTAYSKNGMGNILDSLEDAMIKNGIAPLTQMEKDHIMRMGIVAVANQNNVKLLETLKQDGNQIIFVTKADPEQVRFTEKFIKEQSSAQENPFGVFDKIITGPQYKIEKEKFNEHGYDYPFIRIDSQVIMSSGVPFEEKFTKALKINARGPIHMVSKNEKEDAFVKQNEIVSHASFQALYEALHKPNKD